MAKQQTIEQALHSPSIRRAINELNGKPVGGWGETEQAMMAIHNAIPHREDRAYTTQELLARAADGKGSHWRVKI